MPPVPGTEGAFYALPDSKEIASLDKRWAAGEFLARVDGRLMFRDDKLPVVLFVADGQDPQLAGGALVVNSEPRADAYLGAEVVWRHERPKESSLKLFLGAVCSRLFQKR